MSGEPLELITDPERLAAVHLTGLAEKGTTESFDRLCALACEVLGTPIALVSIVDHDRQVFAGAMGLPEPFATTGQTPLSHSICQHTIASDGPLRIDDTAGDERLEGNLALSELSARAYLGVPLVDPDGHALGSLCVIDHERRGWTDPETALLEALGASVMSEINLLRELRNRGSLDDVRAQLAAVERRRRVEAEAMFALTRELATVSGFEAIATAVAEHAGASVGADLSNLGVAQEGGEFAMWHASELDDLIARRWETIPFDCDTPLGLAAVSGQRVLIDDLDRAHEQFPAAVADIAEAGMVAYCALPLPRGPGALGFGWKSEQVFAESMLRALDTVAELCDQALERAATADRHRRVARALQRVLLPQQLPDIPNADLAARYEAAGDKIDVGGDWYDCRLLGDDRFVLMIGDVVGSGIAAAAIMGQLRQAFTGLVAAGSDLSELIEGIDVVASELDGATLTTAIGATFEPSSRRMEVVTAGHLPVMVRRAGGVVEIVPTGDLPLGLVPSERRTVHLLDLSAGDIVVFYTDGLVERRDRGIDASLEQLSELLSGIDGRTSAEAVSAGMVCDRLVAALATDEHDDDVAVMALVVE